GCEPDANRSDDLPCLLLADELLVSDHLQLGIVTVYGLSDADVRHSKFLRRPSTIVDRQHEHWSSADFKLASCWSRNDNRVFSRRPEPQHPVAGNRLLVAFRLELNGLRGDAARDSGCAKQPDKRGAHT